MISICKVNNFFADKSQSDEDFVFIQLHLFQFSAFNLYRLLQSLPNVILVSMN